jgi:hypothetical protein
MTLVLPQVTTMPLGGDRLLVGRELELRELGCGLQEAIAGRGSLFMLAGEPGIGKTMLMEALAAEAETSDVWTVWGRCWEGGGAPAYRDGVSQSVDIAEPCQPPGPQRPSQAPPRRRPRHRRHTSTAKSRRSHRGVTERAPIAG